MPAPNTPQSFMRQVAIPPVIRDECWTWTGQTITGGYGRVGWGGGKVLAHRVAYELFEGSIPHGSWVLHRCDNPPCVRPSHLFLGSRQDNIDDMVTKGRQRTGGHLSAGEANAQAKLTWEKVAEIRAKYVPRTYSLSRLAREYGVSTDTIHAVVTNRSWIALHGPTTEEAA
jgi:hypothetical protein